jgi:hypothetical protein
VVVRKNHIACGRHAGLSTTWEESSRLAPHCIAEPGRIQIAMSLLICRRRSCVTHSQDEPRQPHSIQRPSTGNSGSVSGLEPSTPILAEDSRDDRELLPYTRFSILGS